MLSQVQAEKSDAQNTDNYQYDEIGNLIKDTKEGITSIEWNVYGKIKSITKGAMTITYTYDAAGNRISKEVNPASGPTRKTYYVRDATGNVMSVYEEGGLVNDGNLTQTETHLYGSSRLGIFKPDVDMTTLVATDVYGFDRGKKFFELSNHLGNVLVTVTDRKNGVELSGNTALVDYYLPDVATASDYYPFGMTMLGRSSHIDKYRYGFNGKEKDGDLHSLTAYDYGFRIYNPALGKFLSVDPLMKNYPMLTSYQFASNRPIDGIDLDGLEYLNKTVSIINISLSYIEYGGARAVVGNVSFDMRKVSDATASFIQNQPGGQTIEGNGLSIVAHFKGDNFEEIKNQQSLAMKSLNKTAEITDAEAESLGQTELQIKRTPRNKKEARKMEKERSFFVGSSGGKSATADGIMAMVTVATWIGEYINGSAVDADKKTAIGQLSHAKKAIDDVQFALTYHLIPPSNLEDIGSLANYLLDGEEPTKVNSRIDENGKEHVSVVVDNSKLKIFDRIKTSISQKREELSKKTVIPFNPPKTGKADTKTK